MGGEDAEGTGEVEAEELTGPGIVFGLGLDHAVGDKGEPVAGSELHGGDFVFRMGDDAQGKGAGNWNLDPVEIRRQVAGIGQREQAAGGDVRGQAGGKAAVGAAHEPVVERVQHGAGVR